MQLRWPFIAVSDTVFRKPALQMRSKKNLYLAFAALGILFIGGCRADAPKSSDNIALLNEIVDVQFPAKSGRWEIFMTPETSGGFLTAPADYVTLVAELKPGSPWFESQKEPTGEVFIVPEAPRAWLTSSFRKTLDKYKNSSVNLSGEANCRKYSTTLKKTGRQSSGFVCNDSGRILMYLTIGSAKEIEGRLSK